MSTNGNSTVPKTRSRREPNLAWFEHNQKGLGATGFRVSQNNGLSANQTVYHAHFHVVPYFGDGPPGTPAPRRKLPPEEYASIAAKLKSAWPK
jgi:diadenosine tetraphosphate (Ap4A) HIT family hydrolase